MATILLNDEAPKDENIRFSLANVEFELGAGKTYDTDELDVLGAANVHPWLTVEVNQEEPQPVVAGTNEPPAPEGAPAPPIDPPTESVASTRNGGRN